MKFAASYRIGTSVVVLIAYGILLWLLLRFLEADFCADAGGIFDAATSTCVRYRPDEFRPLSDRPIIFWLFVALVPALPVAAGAFFGHSRSKAKHG